MINEINRIILRVHILIVYSLITLLISAFIIQLYDHELPCPLCLLQRVGFVGIGIGLLLNLRFGFKPSHYAITLLSGFYTCFVALRQVALHILPNAGVYGSAIFNLHLYTWSVIVSTLIVLATSILLSVDSQYAEPKPSSKQWQYIVNITIIVFALIVLLNLISVFLECGLSACPDNPITYLILDKLIK